MEDGQIDISAESASSKSQRRQGEQRREPEAKSTATPRAKGRRGPAPVERKEKDKKEHGRRKTTPKRAAGGAIATAREQADKDGPKNPELATQYRKLEEMDNLATTKKRVTPSAVPKKESDAPRKPESVRELVAPDEWDSMLNAFDENGVTTTSHYKSAPGEIEIDSEDLWERLSSTRWLKEQNTADKGSADDEESSNKTTVRK